MDQKREESREIIDWMSYHADRVTKFMIGIMMVMMITIVLFGVLNRFIFKIPLSWTEEVSRYLMIWVSMLGAAVAVRAGTHVGVSLFI